MYFKYPQDDGDCMRMVKRKSMSKGAKRVYLANTTLIVVPGILVQQWKDEMEKHIETDKLKVLEVTKDELPPIQDLLSYDVSLPPA